MNLGVVFDDTENEKDADAEAPRARNERGPLFADMNVGRPVRGTVECTAWHCRSMNHFVRRACERTRDTVYIERVSPSESQCESESEGERTRRERQVRHSERTRTRRS